MYGQIDAPRQWFSRACSALLNVGLRQHPLAPCDVLSYNNHDKIDGVSVLLHVDDIMAGASDSRWPGGCSASNPQSRTKPGSAKTTWRTVVPMCITAAPASLRSNYKAYTRKLKPVTLTKSRVAKRPTTSTGRDAHVGALRCTASRTMPAHGAAVCRCCKVKSHIPRFRQSMPPRKLLVFSGTITCLQPYNPFHIHRIGTRADANIHKTFVCKYLSNIICTVVEEWTHGYFCLGYFSSSTHFYLMKKLARKVWRQCVLVFVDKTQKVWRLWVLVFAHDLVSHAGNWNGLLANTGLFLSTGNRYPFPLSTPLNPFRFLATAPVFNSPVSGVKIS